MSEVMSNIRLQAASSFERLAINGSSEGEKNSVVHFKQSDGVVPFRCFFQLQNVNRK